jgi:hypothetical protein
MTDPQHRATSYLSPTIDSFWRWSGDGEVLTWSDGRTIAFAREVEVVLGRLSSRGLPPFGAVALLLAACREGWDESGGREIVRGYVRIFGQWQTGAITSVPMQATQTVFARAARQVGGVLEGLDTVGRLPPGLREGVDAKSLLAEVVFKRADPVLNPDDAAAVVSALRDGIDPDGLLPRLSTRESLSQFAEDIDALRPGLADVDEERLALRVRTGLEQLVQPAELDLAPSERVRRLLAELRTDEELAGLARLAQDLMAAVHVPRALHARDELPLGGVSDLANHGPLDRLLVSELAHDDLTLAVRVATNEALFLRRESPPRQPPSRRAILIDSGIRMWGIPRVFGTAVALALVATADKWAELVTYRATPDGVERVDLTTRAGLIDCLAGLEASPHPGHSLKPFFDRLAEREEGLTDALLVTHPDVLADPEFAASFASLDEDEPALYVAAVGRNGRFSLMVLSRAGRKPVREAVLSLDAILAPPPGKQKSPAGSPLRVKEIDPALPVILTTEPLPLLLPHVVDPCNATASKRHGLVAATKDGRLLQWTMAGRGARQLTAMLPRGQVRGLFVNDDAATAALVIHHRRVAQTHLVAADLSSGRCNLMRLEAPAADPEGTFVHGGFLFLVYTKLNQLEAFDLATGRRVGSVELPSGAVWRGGRFLYLSRHWHAVTCDGRKVKLEPVPYPRPLPREGVPIVVLFERPGGEGYWALLTDGRVVSPDGLARIPPLGVIDKFLGVSPDGGTLVVSANVGGPRTGTYVLDLDGVKRWLHTSVDPATLLAAPQIHWSTRSWVNPRTKIRGIFTGTRGELWLRTRQGTELMVGMNEAEQLILMERGHSPAPPAMREFGHRARVPGTRYDLWVATWADGSRAFLDSRGMLHLKSADPSVPEITLVLTNDKLAGWSSDGKVFGAAYFNGDATATTPAYFEDAIRRFTGRLR